MTVKLHSTGTCQTFPHRIPIEQLVPLVQRQTGLDASYVENTLRTRNCEEYPDCSIERIGVNNRNDRLRADEKKFEIGFVPPDENFDDYATRNSISREEAFRFIDQVRRFIRPRDRLTVFTEHPKDRIAKALYNIYFGDMPLYERDGGTPSGIPPHEHKPLVFFKKTVRNDDLCNAFSPEGCYAHDGDTANVSEYNSEECFAASIPDYTGTYREANSDSPERGELPYYPDDPNSEKNAERQAANAKMILWLYKKVQDPQFSENAPSFVNIKIVDNAIKVLRAIMKRPEDLNMADLYHLVSLIVKWIDYDGTLAFVQMNDMIDFIQTTSKEKVRFYTEETTIRFESGDTPAWKCGFKQVDDRYLRELISPGVMEQRLLGVYIDTRLIPGFLGFSKRTGLYERYRAEIDEIQSRLRGSKDPQVKRVASMFSSDRLYRPESIFPRDPRKIKGLIAQFFATHRQYEKDYIGSLTVLKILLGIQYPYQKYRTQNFKLFMDAGEFARRNGLGFWQKFDPTFSVLWDENAKIPRYFPVDCMTGER